MDTVLQGIEPLKDVLGSEGVTGLARTLAEACANEIMSAEVTYNFLRTLTAE